MHAKLITVFLSILLFTFSFGSEIPVSPAEIAPLEIGNSVPAVFLTDKTNTITYRYFNADYTVRLSPEELLAAAKQR